jgi:hypothetical protein
MTLKSAGLHMLFTLLLLSSSSAVFAEDDASKPAKLFSTTETLEVTMFAPWKTVQRKKNYDGTYPAKIEFTDSLGNKNTLDLTVERRGITRQTVCRFPPIKLRFQKETVKGTTFRGEKSIKMVTHCNKGTKWEQYYVTEMVAYQFYNLITDFSFKIRPLSITYIDSENGKDLGPMFAFLIEDDSDVAKRNGQDKLDITKTKASKLDPIEASNLALFQYMIGNLDFSSMSGPNPDKCCHNAKLLGLDPENGPIYPVPYDFDSSGLVNAHYAAPPANLPVSNVSERLYRGFCRHNDTLPQARQKFLDNEQAIFAVVENEDKLTASSTKKIRKYLAQFFKTMKSDKDWERKIIKKCRK